MSEYTKTLGLEWNVKLDCFRLTIAKSFSSNLTKRTLVSNIAKVFDILGWFSPSYYQDQTTLAACMGGSSGLG